MALEGGLSKEEQESLTTALAYKVKENHKEITGNSLVTLVHQEIFVVNCKTHDGCNDSRNYYVDYISSKPPGGWLSYLGAQPSLQIADLWDLFQIFYLLFFLD